METQKSPEMLGVGRELVVSRPGSIAERAVAPSSQALDGGWQPLWDLFQGRPSLLGFPNLFPV